MNITCSIAWKNILPIEKGEMTDYLSALNEDHAAQMPPPLEPERVPLPQKTRKPFLRIIEQPSSKGSRFRYECEQKFSDSIIGASSTPLRKTYPAIQIVGHEGAAMIVVSCVTTERPYRPHPHNLVGKGDCDKGVRYLKIHKNTRVIEFQNLIIRSTKKKDIIHSLDIRQQLRVDPFQTGFKHKYQPNILDLSTVRLCFQAFIESSPGIFNVPLKPIVSDPILDKRKLNNQCNLTINNSLHCISPASGGEMYTMVLCEKVANENLQVRFFEDSDWEAFVDLPYSQIHKQNTVWFKAPPYKDSKIAQPVNVFIQLCQPSATSEPIPFQYLPVNTDIQDRTTEDPTNPSTNLALLENNDKDLGNPNYVPTSGTNCLLSSGDLNIDSGQLLQLITIKDQQTPLQEIKNVSEELRNLCV